MGMFDSDLGKPFADHFAEGESFVLEAIKLGPMIPTSFGDSRIVFLTIGGERFSIFGKGIENQARNMESDDLPARVKLSTVPNKDERRSPMKVFVPATVSDVPSDGAPKKAKKTDTDDIPF